MYRLLSGFVGLLSLVLVACSSQPSAVTDFDPGYDFAGLKTFYVLETKQGEESPQSLLVSPFTLGHLHGVIQQNLNQRYQRVDTPEQADFLVRYHVVLEDRLDARHYNSYYGYGHHGFSSHFYGHGHHSHGSRAQVYRQGSLILDMVDAKTEEPIWRGVSEERLRDSYTPQERRKILSAAANFTLSKFPPTDDAYRR